MEPIIYGIAKETFELTLSSGIVCHFTKDKKYKVDMSMSFFYVYDDKGTMCEYDYFRLIEDFIFLDTQPPKPDKIEIKDKETLIKDIETIKKDISWARENNKTTIEKWLLECLITKEEKLHNL